MTRRTFTHDQLVLSPLNVRTNQEDANATEALEASIESGGLLYPLIVHPVGDQYGVCAGGRRWRAIGNLIAAGKLPADWPIECVIRDVDAAQITEISLNENILRRELRPYEVHAAIAKAHEEGASAEDIASRCGQRVDWVRQQLRLGQLAAPIFEAYVENRLSIEQAQAYAATEDRDLQLAAFSHLSSRPAYDHTPSAIRGYMGVGDRELVQLLRLVGAEAYLAAGGYFERDLFHEGPDMRGRISDAGLLRKLAEARFASGRDNVRELAALPDLRFAPRPPQLHGGPDNALEIEVTWSNDRPVGLPEGDIVATLELDEVDELYPRFWWASRKAKRDAEGTPDNRENAPPSPSAAFDDAEQARGAAAAVKDEFGLSGDGLQVVRGMRRELLRALLVDDSGSNGTLGRDYAVWSQLRQLLGNAGPAETGMHEFAAAYHPGSAEAPQDLVQPVLETMGAHATWLRAIERVRAMPAFTIQHLPDAFEAFVGAEEAEKRLAGAVLAGLALIGSANVPGWRVPLHDRVAELAGGTDRQLRCYWTPTSEFTGMFAKLKRLELAQPFVDPAGFKGWHKMDDRVISSSVAMALQGEEGSPYAYRVAAAGWMHPLLSFGVRESAVTGKQTLEVDLDLSGMSFASTA